MIVLGDFNSSNTAAAQRIFNTFINDTRLTSGNHNHLVTRIGRGSQRSSCLDHIVSSSPISNFVLHDWTEQLRTDHLTVCASVQFEWNVIRNSRVRPPSFYAARERVFSSPPQELRNKMEFVANGLRTLISINSGFNLDSRYEAVEETLKDAAFHLFPKRRDTRIKWPVHIRNLMDSIRRTKRAKIRVECLDIGASGRRNCSRPGD